MSCHSVSRVTADWSEAELLTLRRLWAEGVTAMAIGREMGRSRNSIVGKAHRLELAPRPSPIGQRRGEVREAKPRETLPVLASAARPVVVRPSVVRLAPVQIAALGRRPPAPPPSPPPPGPPQAPAQTVEGCQYPTSEGRPWRFCGAPTDGCGPYCQKHQAVAWIRRPVRGALENV